MMRLAAILATVVALACGAQAAVRTLDAVKGAQVWYAEDHTVPVVALTASFPAGSIYDPYGKAGTATYAAGLLDEGAGNLDFLAFQAALADHGIELSVTPGRDSMTITLITLSSNVREAFRLLGLALAHPRFDPDAMARVRVEMLQDIEQDRGDPEAVAEKAYYSLFFGPYSYGRPIDGDPASLVAVSQQDLRAFVRSHWVRGGLKIALTGDIDPLAAAAVLRAAFGSLPPDAPPEPAAPPRIGAPGLHVFPMLVSQPAVLFGLPGLKRGNPDYLAAMIANYILGGGENARLGAELREKRGLTYDVSTDLVPYRGVGMLLGETSSRREAVRQAIAAIRDTMRRFATDGPTDDEIADAKAYLNGSFPRAFTTNAGLSAQLNELQQEGLPLDYLEKRSRLIDAVSADDVRRAARRYFDPAKLTVVVAGSIPQERRPYSEP
ncbi:MAG: insulinase family protein [Alphaproteobacteria bacterium]|nr:insulinase family protein [Alphaproteobacteria bacterium]